MPKCQSVIWGNNLEKNYKKHYCMHFFTVHSLPCSSCGLIDKLGFQINIKSSAFKQMIKDFFEIIIHLFLIWKLLKAYGQPHQKDAWLQQETREVWKLWLSNWQTWYHSRLDTTKLSIKTFYILISLSPDNRIDLL